MDWDKNYVISIITSTVALLVAVLSGVFTFLSTRQTTKVERQKAYYEFLQHKMNKLEDAQNSFNISFSGVDVLDSFPQHARVINNKTNFVLIAYSYLFTHYKEEYDQLLKDNDVNSEADSKHLLRQLSYPVEIDGDLSEMDIAIKMFDNAEKVRLLISKELAATYSDFEELTRE